MFVNADGRLRSDVEWQIKTQLVYQLPAGFMVSANFSYRSGALTHPAHPVGRGRDRHPGGQHERADPAAARRERAHQAA